MNTTVHRERPYWHRERPYLRPCTVHRIDGAPPYYGNASICNRKRHVPSILMVPRPYLLRERLYW